MRTTVCRPGRRENTCQRRYHMALAVCFAIALSTLLLEQAGQAAGPFGLSMGMSIEEIDPYAVQVSPGLYQTTAVPSPRPPFAAYNLTVGAHNRLCTVSSFSNRIATDGDGFQLCLAFLDWRSKIQQRFGRGITIEKPSEPAAPDRFMEELAAGKRTLIAIWNVPHPYEEKDNVERIQLMARAAGANTGSLYIKYTFTNHQACSERISRLAGSPGD